MTKMSDDDLAAARAESDAIDAIEGDDPPMHFRADGSLHTGLTGVPAPTHADDVAALRSMIGNLYAGPDSEPEAVVALLDRIAGAVPQRATDADDRSKGDPLWLHTCGGVMPGEGDRQPHECPRHSCGAGNWRALYVLGGTA